MFTFVSCVGFILSLISAIVNIVVSVLFPIEDKWQTRWNFMGLLFDVCSSFWFSNFGGPMDSDVYFAIVGAMAAVATMYADRVANHAHYKGYEMWFSWPVIICVVAPILWIHKRSLLILLTPRALSFISATLPLVGSKVVGGWKCGTRDAYCAILAAGYTFCWVDNTQGKIDTFLICATGCMRIVYAVCCVGLDVIMWRGLEAMWSRTNAIWNKTCAIWNQIEIFTHTLGNFSLVMMIWVYFLFVIALPWGHPWIGLILFALTIFICLFLECGRI